uniref:Neurogenic locus Notch protein n=1 Tax=Caenorhabditis tropicalis TaxID=1561998 RepID=A0A1I7U5R3_9PELO
MYQVHELKVKNVTDPLCSTPSLNPCLENPCNSGKCYRIPGGYQCICDNGFRGSSCEIGTDHCLNNKCADGSVCVNTDIDYYCACPPGKSGKRCEIANCGCAHGRCVDSPTGGVCECHEGFEGDYCDIDKDECRIPGICMNNGTCVNIPGGFQCLCRPGYTGDLCQDPLDTCKDHPCQNQGECATLPDQTPICICPQGFMGDRCETPCPPGYGGYQCTLTQPHCSRKRGPCWNGGVCIHGFCKCPPEFTGDRCERKRCPVGYSEPECEKKTERCEECLNGGKCLETSGLCDCPYGYKGTRCQDIVEEEGLCLQHNCSSLASNSICNPECNSKECGFDGGDCSDSPFAKCLYPSRCAEIFGNGVCDQECNNEGCLFDGLDCQEHPKCPERSHCVLRRGDGVCDPECSLIGCGFDGGDCSQGDTQILRDIRVRIHLDALEEALMDISARLRATVRIQKDSKGPLVFDDTEKRVEGLIQGQVVLYLEVECEGKCRFSSAQSVVDLIAAGLVKSDGRSSLGLPITDAMVAAPRGTESHTLYIILGFLGIGVLIAVVILKGSRSRKRKIITAPVWIPPLPSMEAGSSQCSLLDGYYGETKRWETYPGQMGLTAKEIPLHLQAASSEPITCLLTPQSVNQLDATYHRNVLHWLAGNTNGKPEDLIVDETRRCLEIGAAVNTRDSDDNTPLMLAVKTRRLRLAVVLLRSHADPTIFNKSERSALHEAVANKDLRMAEILLTDERLQKEIDELDRNGMTALMSVASGSQLIALAKLLIDRGAKLDADGGTRKDSDR